MGEVAKVWCTSGPPALAHQCKADAAVCRLQIMSKNKVLVKVHPEGRYVVGLDKSIDINEVTVGARVALRNDSYTLHVLLPTKVLPAPVPQSL